MHITEEELIKAFKPTLPGEQVQYELAPVGRQKSLEVMGANEAAVLCLFYLKKGKWHIVFIERTSHNNKDKHKGQISFPGGRIDPKDKDEMACALREAEEEIGIRKQDIQIIRDMTPLYIPVSNYKVFPFVGLCTQEQKFKLQASEVADLHLFSLAELLFLPNIKAVFVQSENRDFKFEVPAYKLDQATIWGATAMILHECLHMVRSHLHM